MANRAELREPDIRMTREEFRAWAERQPLGRFERVDGVVLAMAPERAAHNRRKAAVRDALRSAVQAAGLTCEVFADGMTVEVGDSDYEPDVVLQCGPRLPDDVIAIPDPLAIVEVLSPTTSGIDRGHKLREYFRIASLRHYLIVWPEFPRAVRHSRRDDGTIATEVIASGTFRLDPPGISVSFEAFYQP